MTDEHVPRIETVKAMIEKIDHGVEIKRVKYDSDKMEHKFLLSKDDRTCEVSLSRDLLDDLNDYTGSRESKYWIALEYTLKKRLSIPLQMAGLIPFSSSIFFEDLQEWEQDNGHNIKVYYYADDYEIFQDGLKKLRNYLETKKAKLSYLKLGRFPYEDDLIDINRMISYREEQVSNRGQCDFSERISVTSRMHFKAAAIVQFVFLQHELTHGRHSEAVKKEIAAKISRILLFLSKPYFEKIEVAKYLHDIKEDMMATDQSKAAVQGIRHERNYDVVISFAGEDREHAGRLAELLRYDDFEVFYDEYEEHDLWGKNLYEHLTEIYSKRGKYCVMFLSRYYAEKQWPTLERRAAQEKAFKENREYILPIRIDDTVIPGILDTVGYQDLREKGIDEIYSILKRKLSSHA